MEKFFVIHNISFYVLLYVLYVPYVVQKKVKLLNFEIDTYQ